MDAQKATFTIARSARLLAVSRSGYYAWAARYYFGRHVRHLGLPRIRLHDLRHTHATLALRAGVHPRVVQERLGHANVSVTLDTYSHVDMDMQAVAAARVAALLTGDLE
jgi:integrase